MIQWFRTHKVQIGIVFGYAVYTLLAILLFLILTFPYDQIEGNLVAWIEERTPLHLSLEERSYLFPLGFHWKSATVGVPLPLSEEAIFIKDLNCRVAFFPLLLGQVQGSFSMNTMEGFIKGEFQFDPSHPTQRFHFSGNGKGLELSFLNGFLPEAMVRGKLAMQWNHDWENEDVLRGNGSAFLNVEEFSVRDFSYNGFPIQTLFISQGTSRLKVNGGRGTLEEIRVQGDMVELDGTGSLLLRYPIHTSLLNLDLKALLKGELKENELIHLMIPSVRNGEKLRIIGKGSLRNIQWSINGVDLTSLFTM